MGTDRRDGRDRRTSVGGRRGPRRLRRRPDPGLPGHQGNIAATTLSFTAPPSDGDYVAGVLVDGIVRDQSAGVALPGCTKNTLPHTGSLTIPLLATGLVLVAVGFGLVRRTGTN